MEEVAGFCNYNPEISTWPILVIGTTNQAAEEYAQLLRLDHYVVGNDVDKIQGLKLRGLVLTPGYISQLRRALWGEFNLFDNAMLDLTRALAPLG